MNIVHRKHILIIFLGVALFFSPFVFQSLTAFAYGGGGGGGSGGSGSDGMSSVYNPYGLAVGSDMLFMSHSSWNHIKVYDLDGVLLDIIGDFGIKDGFLIEPYGIAIHENLLYVVDVKNKRIQVFTMTGDFVFSFGKSGIGNGQFQKPYDIAIEQNMIFVTDPKNNRIQIFDLTGNFISNFKPSHDNLRHPSEIAVSGDRIFLTDTKKAGIFVYDLNGNPITEFDSKGDGEKKRESSNDLLTYENHLLVVDGENNRIQVFDFEGNYIRMFGAFVPQNPNVPVPKNEAPHSITHSNNKFYVGHTGSFNVKTYDAYDTNSIPSWVKNNAGWWADGDIPDSAFIDGIEYLIKEEIIVVPMTKLQSEEESSIPSWVKNNAGWWADGDIPDSAFIDGIEYLVKSGIIQVT